MFHGPAPVDGSDRGPERRQLRGASAAPARADPEGCGAGRGRLSTIKQHHLQAPRRPVLLREDVPAWLHRLGANISLFGLLCPLAQGEQEHRVVLHRVKGIGPAPSRVTTIRKDVRAGVVHPGEERSWGCPYWSFSVCKEGLKKGGGGGVFYMGRE